MIIPISDRMSTIDAAGSAALFKTLGDPTVISFAGGSPSEGTFPVEELRQISDDMYRDDPAGFLRYGVARGYDPLREILRERLTRKYNLFNDYDDIMITTSGQQAIDLVLRTLTNEGDTVICESPTFVGALDSIRSWRPNLVGIPTDNDGMQIDLVEQALKTEKNVKLIYTIPDFQNPGGVTMSLERRKRLYELAVQYDVMILEDTPYFELRYSGEQLPRIKSLDKTGHVIFCCSMSKIMAPGLRVGYLIMDRQYLPSFLAAKQGADLQTAVYPQALVAEYIKRYDLDAHIAKCCDVYRLQRDRMLRAIEAHFDPRVQYTRPDGGLFIWCTLPEGYRGVDLVAMAAERRVAVVPGSSFDPRGGQESRSFRMNYSLPSPEKIDEGVAILGEVLKELLK